MIDRPIVRPNFRAEVVDQEGVFLLSERGCSVLHGDLFSTLVPLLDGVRTREEVATALAEIASPSAVYRALDLLEQKGYVVEADPKLLTEWSSFWYALNRNPPMVDAQLSELQVSLLSLGEVAPPVISQLVSSLGSLGITVAENGQFDIVITDDYLQDGLSKINAAALTAERPWLILKPVGSIAWVGPIFWPGKSACWECLAQRLRWNRPIETFVQNKLGAASPFPLPSVSLPTTIQTAIQFAATEVAKAIVAPDQQAYQTSLFTFDMLRPELRTHNVVRRPQCPSCGSPSDPLRVPMPLALQSQRKQFIKDGGHRTVPPHVTVARYELHVGPITGAVPFLERVALAEDRGMHVYIAGSNPAALSDDSLYFVRQGLRSACSGKGRTDAQARASGLCEALERYSGVFQGDEPRLRSSFQKLTENAIHPNDCMLFSEEQYRQRNAWNARRSRTTHVPAPFDEAAEMDWTPVWSITHQTFKYLPTAYCYFAYRDGPGAEYCRAESNGSAAGNTIEEAILQGFMELVERDCVALWWYNRIRRPSIDIESFDDPYFQEMMEQYNLARRDLWAIDLTNDLGIPCVAALSSRRDKNRTGILLGFGAHFDARIALTRAITEMNQFIVMPSGPDGPGDIEHSDPELRDWWSTAAVSDHPFLVSNGFAPRMHRHFATFWSEDLREDVLRCQEIVASRGMELLVLDQSRPDIGLPVAKVIVPGLRHFWPRYKSGRLFEIPVALGWLSDPLKEEQLNSTSLAL